MTRTERDAGFEELLEFVREARGFDYTSYKRPSLVRRFEKRMRDVGAGSYDAYRTRLENDPDEFAELFDTVLINVTRFYRDPEAWDALRAEAIARVVARDPSEPIRVWSAGCATGEEAYTIAILLADAVGERGFHKRVKIYATDVDEDALRVGRSAAYAPKALEDLPADLRDRYFEPVNGAHRVRGGIRRAVIFGRNDVLTDSPISRVDLLVCRNTLMYFSRDAQTRILANFHFGLRRDGFLFLGKAEASPARGDLFAPVDLRHRIFAPTPVGGVERPPFARPHDDPARRAHVELDPHAGGAGFEHAPVSQVVVDGDGRLAAVNAHARLLFGIAGRDVGRPLQDLEISYRPLELRSAIEDAYAEGRPLVRRDVELDERSGGSRRLDVHLAPLFGPDGAGRGVAISFTDVTRSHALDEELARARADLSSAYRELQATVEELETTNEELHSTNEELETTNEELHSTNEELETMNEELQSTNEELETMNDELRDRTDEALRASGFLTSILQSIEQSIVVLDEDLRVTAWSKAAADLWGLRADEVEGEHLMGLDIGLPVAELADGIRAAASADAGEPLELTARNRLGQLVRCSVRFSQLRNARGEPRGVVLITETERLPESF